MSAESHGKHRVDLCYDCPSCRFGLHYANDRRRDAQNSFDTLVHFVTGGDFACGCSDGVPLLREASTSFDIVER